MRIALALFGLPRNSPLIFPFLRKNLLAPLAAAGELKVVARLWRQQHVRNERSGEDDALPAAHYLPFERFVPVVVDRPAQVPPPFEALQAYGDAWSDGSQSLANCVLQLHALQDATALVAPLAADVVVFARCDLLYHEPLPASELDFAAAHPDSVVLPEWESWGGFNDRFAICGAQAVHAYGERVGQAQRYCEETGRPLHAETFLRWALQRQDLPVRLLRTRASRVRVDGRMELEDFEGRRTPLATATLGSLARSQPTADPLLRRTPGSALQAGDGDPLLQRRPGSA